VLELICHTLTHNCIRTRSAHDWRTTTAAVVVTWSLGYGLDFLLGLWLFFLGVLALEKGALPWLAIRLLQELFCLSRLRCSGVAFVPMVG
jgi:hypothetical protein